MRARSLDWLAVRIHAVFGFFRYGLARFDRGRLRRGDPAPDVLLHDLQGGECRLSACWRDRPVVLVFGSFT